MGTRSIATIPVTVWSGCYDRQWGSTLIPDCYKHPAKYSPGLIDRILRYGAEKGYWAPGMRMGDPFGGVGCGAVVAADQGYGHVGADKFKDPAKAAKIMAGSKKGHSATPEARQRQFERDSGKSYGEDPGQVGRKAGETYWQAMKKVYASCFETIKPGGYMAIVVKDYVRNWQRVPLCDDTMKLLVHIGFKPVERIHAMLVDQLPHHTDMFTGAPADKTKTERKSFFRRLQEKRGAPEINYEEVLIVRKPA